MVGKYTGGLVPPRPAEGEAEERIRGVADDAIRNADAAIERLAVGEAIASVWTLVDALNGYITEQAPRALSKDEANAERLQTALGTVL